MSYIDKDKDKVPFVSFEGLGFYVKIKLHVYMNKVKVFLVNKEDNEKWDVRGSRRCRNSTYTVFLYSRVSVKQRTVG